jgi:hypothetical protein
MRGSVYETISSYPTGQRPKSDPPGIHTHRSRRASRHEPHHAGPAGQAWVDYPIQVNAAAFVRVRGIAPLSSGNNITTVTAMPDKYHIQGDRQNLLLWHYWLSVADLVCQEEKRHGHYSFELHNLRWHCIDQANALFPENFYLILQMEILPDVVKQKGGFR